MHIKTNSNFDFFLMARPNLLHTINKNKKLEFSPSFLKWLIILQKVWKGFGYLLRMDYKDRSTIWFWRLCTASDNNIIKWRDFCIAYVSLNTFFSSIRKLNVCLIAVAVWPWETLLANNLIFFYYFLLSLHEGSIGFMKNF